jgi:16S rRNA (cytosine1402-N4)-methyltransferase
MEKTKHIPVLLDECLENLKLCPGKTIVDGTLGGAGHSIEILKKISPGGTLVGIDKDPQAIERCKKNLKEKDSNVLLMHDDYKNIVNILSYFNIEEIDGALLDLGVSSFQLEDHFRGFSYKADVKLDMRMDNSQGFTALDVVNGYSAKELTDIFYKYGEEKWSKRIAEFIVERRQIKKISTSGELTKIIKAAVPLAARKGIKYPSMRCFQAIRIEVNSELKNLEVALDGFTKVIKTGGRFAIITFHSLEDRIVKHFFKKMQNPCECPPDAPICICGKKPTGKVITRKPIIPQTSETDVNNRSRSAKLRVVEML